MEAIPQETALQLCEEIRAANRGKWYTSNGIWCLICEKQAKGDSARLCFSNTPEYRGCSQVNQRYDQGKDRSSSV